MQKKISIKIVYHGFLCIFCVCIFFFDLTINSNAAFGGYEGQTFLPDEYELDDTPENASYIALNAFAEQLRNFHKADDQDWIQFHALKTDTAIEISAFDLGKNSEPVITLYDTDALSIIFESRQVWDPYSIGQLSNTLSWRPLKDGIYYARITNKNGENFGSNARYSLRVGRPIGPEMGFIEGLITNKETENAVGDVVIRTVASSSVSSYDCGGCYFILAPAGVVTVTFEKSGYEKLSQDVTIGEASRVELSVELTPSYAYNSLYELAQWGKRGTDTYYCVDICDLTGTPYPGLQAVRCGEDFHAWSPKNYINIILGVPDSTLSGFQFMWKVWSPGGYGGQGFQGVVTVP